MVFVTRLVARSHGCVLRFGAGGLFSKMNNVISKIKSAARRIFYRSESLLFVSSVETQCTSPARIILATRKDINDLRDFQSEKTVKACKRLFDQNQACYLAYLKSQCVHRSFVVHGPCKVSVDPLLQREIKEGDIFIHYCETAFSARGHGIYPAVLTRISRDFRSRRVFLAVNYKNVPSILGVTKAGFILFERIKILIIFGIKIVRKQEVGMQTKSK